MRKALLTVVVAAITATAAPAQKPWVEKMFKDGLTHDFGSVPRGAQLFHRFTITNIYAVRMEITYLKSGCGCVTVEPSKRVIEPRESAAINVSMDARRFTGPKSVGIRITVGPEFTSTTELRVSANSRADIVFNPGEVNFGTVAQGQKRTTTIDVEYAGALPWQVSEIVARELPLEATVSELYRRPGQVGYRVQVTLKSEVQPGSFKEEIFLKTNDPASPLVPIVVEATVQSALTVTPSALNLGTVRAGDSLTRRVIVQGNQPFRVLGVEGIGDGVTLDPPAATAAPRQIVSFKCQISQPGAFKRELKIKTDLQDSPIVVTIDGNAQ